MSNASIQNQSEELQPDVPEMGYNQIYRRGTRSRPISIPSTISRSVIGETRGRKRPRSREPEFQFYGRCDPRRSLRSRKPPSERPTHQERKTMVGLHSEGWELPNELSDEDDVGRDLGISSVCRRLFTASPAALPQGRSAQLGEIESLLSGPFPTYTNNQSTNIWLGNFLGNSWDERLARARNEAASTSAGSSLSRAIADRENTVGNEFWNTDLFQFDDQFPGMAEDFGLDALDIGRHPMVPNLSDQGDSGIAGGIHSESEVSAADDVLIWQTDNHSSERGSGEWYPLFGARAA